MRLGYWAPPIVWMAMITWFSTDSFSGEHTSTVIGPLLSWLLPWLTPAQADLIHLGIRKLAHVTEYAVLAALWFRALVGDRRWPAPRAAWTALTVSVVWAIGDETHQMFVPSRTASPLDVMIDGVGAALTAALLAARGRGLTPRARPQRVRPRVRA